VAEFNLDPGAEADRGLRVAWDARYLRRRDVGISAYLAAGILQGLNRGWKTHLLTDDPGHAGDLERDFPDASVSVVRARTKSIWEQSAVARHLRVNRYDVFISPANTGLPLLFRGQTRLILIVHDLIPLRYPRRYLLPRPVWASSYVFGLAASLLRADGILCVSRATRADVLRLGRRRGVHLAFPNIAPQRQSDQALPNPAVSARRYFVYSGGYDWRKNVPALLAGFAMLLRRTQNDYSLVVLGNRPRWFDELVSKMGLSEHVIGTGYVGDALRDEITAGAVGLVYTSRYEGYGLPVLEGLMLGVPVVCGSGGSLLEVGGDVVIRVDPCIPRSICEGMIKAIAGVTEHAQVEIDRHLQALMVEREQHSLARAVIASM